MAVAALGDKAVVQVFTSRAVLPRLQVLYSAVAARSHSALAPACREKLSVRGARLHHANVHATGARARRRHNMSSCALCTRTLPVAQSLVESFGTK